MSGVTQAVTQKWEQAVSVQQLDLAAMSGHLPGLFQKIYCKLVWLAKMGLVSLRCPMVVSGRLEAHHIAGELNVYIYWHTLVLGPELLLSAEGCE